MSVELILGISSHDRNHSCDEHAQSREMKATLALGDGHGHPALHRGQRRVVGQLEVVLARHHRRQLRVGVVPVPALAHDREPA